MADRRPKDLPTTTRVGSGSYIVLDHEVDGTTKIDYDKLAKAIIENFTGSELAGSGQSVKAAIDALAAWTTSNSADDTLDTTSDHPVQNAPVATAINSTNTLMGSADISGIGGGTVTGAINKLYTDFIGYTPDKLYRPLSDNQRSAWTYTCPYTGTLYLGFVATERTYTTINRNGATIGHFAGVTSSNAAFTVTIRVAKGDLITVPNLTANSYIAPGASALIADKYQPD